MGLNSGTRLGPYEIVSPLGAGGMGEVYRARDTRLDRSVAIKILPAHMADKPEAGERFEREARTISSLNHPHICQLHDVGSQDGTRYLVMELLEGETLAERLRRGPLPLDQVLRYGAEIARGLHAAHRCGVVHRDLKPGNIMLTKSGAKLMDFGLAKGMAAAKPVSAELTATMTSSHATPLTQQGTIVGTFQYMAPEQVEGKEADARSDIFSLGAVLYEMLTGKRAFEGKTLVSVAAAILEKEPEPLRNAQPLTPAALERVVKKCLAKDPEERWQSAGDLASELTWVAEGGAAPGTLASAAVNTRQKGSRLPWAVAGIAALTALALGILHFSTRETKQVVLSQIAQSENLQFNFVGDNGGPPVISPDGSQIVFAAKAAGKSQLFVRSLDKLIPQPLVGTLDGMFPFWSPDSRSIGFFAEGKMKRVDLGGGPAVVICEANNSRGGTWGRDGTIVFEPFPTTALSRVPAAGGTPVALTQLSGKYTTHRWPQFMPDGRHYIYLAANHADPTGPDTAVFWASLDGKESKRLLQTHSSAIYAAGYLLYVRETALMAQPFDPASGELKGQPTLLNDDVQVDHTVWRGTFTASDVGPLIYQPGAAGAGLRLTWMDRTGKETRNLLGPDTFTQVELSPDNKKAAVTIGNPSGVIWIYDLEHNTRTRFTFNNGSANSPVWSRDGKQIAYMTTDGGGGHYNIMVKSADGSGEAKTLLQTDFEVGGEQEGLWDWSPDGRYLLYAKGIYGVADGMDLWALPMFGDRKPFPYATGPGDQAFAQFSPDGRWVAYESNETGHLEVFVAPFPWTGAKWQISTSGGIVPRWRRDGKELIYQVLANPYTWAAIVDGRGSSFAVGDVRELFESDDLSPNTAAAQYAVSSDGQRFLEITTGDAGKLPLTVIQNWTAELKK
jgi:serine/threonine protein kinase/WD40 repeat protein